MLRLIVGAGRTSNRIRIVWVSRRKGISTGKTLQSCLIYGSHVALIYFLFISGPSRGSV
jgi:hypothetical protein